MTDPKPAAESADRAELRDRIRRAVCEAEGFAWDSDMLEPDEYGDVADAVLAVLFGPIPADTDTATWTAIRAIQLMNEAGRQRDAVLPAPAVVAPPVDRAARVAQIAAALREHYLCTNRDEADADGNLPCRCGDWREPGAEEDDENDWDSHLAEVAIAVLYRERPALPADTDQAEAHRLALSDALDLGTGAPWDAIHERVQELRQRADEPAAEAHPRVRSWRLEVLEGAAGWLSTGATSQNRKAIEDQHAQAVKDAPGVEFRVVRVTTSYAVEGLADGIARRIVPVQALREPETVQVVAFQAPGSGSLYCVNCCHGNGLYAPLTSEDLPDGGLCADCDVDVLIEPQAPALPSEGEHYAATDHSYRPRPAGARQDGAQDHG